MINHERLSVRPDAELAGQPDLGQVCAVAAALAKRCELEHRCSDGDRVYLRGHLPHGHRTRVHDSGRGCACSAACIDLDSGGSVDGYIAAQERILGLANDETKIIPGHGPLASKADLQGAVDMLKDAQARVGKLIKEGQSEEQILAANPLADYHDDWNWGFITTERMTKTLYRSLAQ